MSELPRRHDTVQVRVTQDMLDRYERFIKGNLNLSTLPSFERWFSMAGPKEEKDAPIRFSHEAWAVLLDATIAQIKSLAELKGGEYAGDTDRLANFRRNAEAMGEGTTMEEVWRIYVSKHWDAIMQYEQDLRAGRTRPRLESLSGRADDVIVYMLLFKAMLQERGEK